MARKQNKYYRGRFLIGVYSALSEGETLLALCDNEREFAELMHTSVVSASNILYKIYKGISTSIVFGNKMRTVEFIEYEE